MKHLFLLIALSACAAVDAAQPSMPAKIDDTCNATSHAALIGQNATALEKVLILGMVRVIRPGTMVTQDYRPERINFMIADDETVSAITCG